MKLLIITEYYPSSIKLDIQGGVEMRTYQVATGLSRQHEVVVIATLERGKPQKQVLNDVTIYRVGVPSIYGRTNILSRLIFSVAATFKGVLISHDIVEGAGFFGWLPALIVSKIRGSKRVLFVADIISQYTYDLASFFQYILLLIEKSILSFHWDLYICISYTVKKKILSFKGINPTRIKVIYCGVYNKKRIYSKNKLYDVVSVSRLVPYKRINDLIDAAYHLKLRGAVLTYIIIGSGEEEYRLRQKIRNLGLEKEVQLTGYIKDHSEVKKIISQSRVFCLPSIVEGFGISTIEAFSLGIPAVVVDIPINHEITRDQGVLFFAKCNSRDLSRKISTILHNKKLYSKLQHETSLIAPMYDWQKIVTQTEEEYTHLYAH